MPSNYPQFLLSSRFCENGDKTIPPATAAQAGTGRFSQAEGWGEINATPLAEGGLPPDRTDFNGVLYVLSQFALWQQQGGLMNWVSTLSYEPGNEVLHNGTKYRCIQACQNIAPPNRRYWKNLDISVKPGTVVQAYNVRVDNAGHPIWWGETEADEGYLLCDGRSDGLGGNVPNAIDRCIRGSLPADAGQTGGADSVRLSVANLPSHTHGVTSVSTAGAHTHERGTMEIEGEIVTETTKSAAAGAKGAFYGIGETEQFGGASGYDKYAYVVGFKASRSWEGETSLNGAHSHSVTIGSTGSGTAVDIKPSYFKMAFFIKLPE